MNFINHLKESSSEAKKFVDTITDFLIYMLAKDILKSGELASMDDSSVRISIGDIVKSWLFHQEIDEFEGKKIKPSIKIIDILSVFCEENVFDYRDYFGILVSKGSLFIFDRIRKEYQGLFKTKALMAGTVEYTEFGEKVIKEAIAKAHQQNPSIFIKPVIYFDQTCKDTNDFAIFLESFDNDCYDGTLYSDPESLPDNVDMCYVDSLPHFYVKLINKNKNSLVAYPSITVSLK